MRTTFVKRTLIISLFFTFLHTFAQIELKNRVVDFGTLLPVESANIYIINTTIGTISNTDGKFVLLVSTANKKDTLVISSIGYKSFKTVVEEFDNNNEIFLEEDVATLDEVLLIAETRPKTGNEIVLRAIKKLPENLPDSAYLQKGFLRHKERNKLEFKWLIESAITVYDSGFMSNSTKNLKINVDEQRKSFDLRDVDSLLSYVSFKNRNTKVRRNKIKKVGRNQVSTPQLIEAIKWNDQRVNGLQNLFHGKLNLLRNSQRQNALLGSALLEKHRFQLDTLLVDNERKIYKIKIKESDDFIGLGTKGIYNEGYIANGWIYIYYDNYAIKRIEYNLLAASEKQKLRSKRLFDTQVNHKLILDYRMYRDKMYPGYIYYETPKLINVGYKSNEKISKEEEDRYNKEERFYYTVQEILFSEIIVDKENIDREKRINWDSDIFSYKPYNEQFWENYNILLESEEDEKMIFDLSRRASLFNKD